MTSLGKGLVLFRGLARVAVRCPRHGGMSLSAQEIHTSSSLMADFDDMEKLFKDNTRAAPTKFMTYNDIIYPPTREGEEIRPAEYCFVRKVAGSAKKFWYSAVLVRGLAIDEAIRQCEFHQRAFPKIIKEVLLEAQENMMKECNVEFPSNMWVADSYVTKGGKYETARRSYRFGGSRIKHPLANYFLRLREGQPPEHYYPREETGYEKLEDYIRDQRLRRIRDSL